jgi:hypothetical protein
VPEGPDEPWRADLSAGASDLSLRFSGAGLVLGAGTVLAQANASARDVAVDVTEPRLVALLAAAHLRSPEPLGLAHLRRAADRWRAGEDALAAMHLALSRLGQLEGADAHRLRLADGLLKVGFDPDTIVKALDLDKALDGQVSKYSPDQPRVPAGSGRSSGEWTSGAGSPSNAASTASGSRDAKQFHVELPSAIIGATTLPDCGPFGEAVTALADTVEVADSISKWRDLGPKGEAAIEAAVQARGWTLLGAQIAVRTTLGLRVEDLMVHVPAGTAGNATAYDGFVEVKVNGGRYSPLQQAKDELIGSVGGILVRSVGERPAGSRIILETGLANVRITYVPE